MIDPRQVVDIPNADVRREFVRKVGLERIYHKLGGKVVDQCVLSIGGKSMPYAVIELQINPQRPWRFLKMENASLPGVWHLEGIPQEVKTVEQAWLYRSGLSEHQVDDIKGAEWYQQGDVILRPKGASTFRRYPSILT